MKAFKQKLFHILESREQNNPAGKIFDIVLVAIVVVNLLFMVLGTFPQFHHWEGLFFITESVSVAIFTVEYILRVWVSDLLSPHLSPAKARLRYIFSFMSLIDLLAILPFYLPFILHIDLRALHACRVIWLLRIFELERYIHALESVVKVLKSKAHQLITTVGLFLLGIFILSFILYNVENRVQPEVFSNAFSGIWCVLSTLIDTGEGIYPVTIMGKILAALIAAMSIGLIAVPTGIISAGFMEHSHAERKEKHFCPHCGESLHD